MKRMPVGIVFMLMGVACWLEMAGCALQQAAMQPISGGSTALSTSPAAAPGGLSDSLKACLARISSESSDGTRMVAEQSCRDNEQLHQDVVGTAIAKSANRASAGTQGDSLEVCMAHIPTDATAGQRMLAEESCKRDQFTHH